MPCLNCNDSGVLRNPDRLCHACVTVIHDSVLAPGDANIEAIAQILGLRQRPVVATGGRVTSGPILPATGEYTCPAIQRDRQPSIPSLPMRVEVTVGCHPPCDAFSNAERFSGMPAVAGPDTVVVPAASEEAGPDTLEAAVARHVAHSVEHTATIPSERRTIRSIFEDGLSEGPSFPRTVTGRFVNQSHQDIRNGEYVNAQEELERNALGMTLQEINDFAKEMQEELSGAATPEDAFAVLCRRVAQLCIRRTISGIRRVTNGNRQFQEQAMRNAFSGGFVAGVLDYSQVEARLLEYYHSPILRSSEIDTDWANPEKRALWITWADSHTIRADDGIARKIKEVRVNGQKIDAVEVNKRRNRCITIDEHGRRRGVHGRVEIIWAD